MVAARDRSAVTAKWVTRLLWVVVLEVSGFVLLVVDGSMPFQTFVLAQLGAAVLAGAALTVLLVLLMLGYWADHRLPFRRVFIAADYLVGVGAVTGTRHVIADLMGDE